MWRSWLQPNGWAPRVATGAKAAWVAVLAGLAEETGYDNFKAEVARHLGSAGAAYERSLHEVWSVMRALQNNVPGE